MKMKRAIVLAAIGSLMACGGGGPTAPAPANIAGTYNATITASSICAAVPSAARVIILGAEVSQTGSAATVLFNPHGGSSLTVSATVSGQSVSFPSLSINGSIEGNAMSVSAAGSQGSVASNGAITTSLSGTFQGSGASCNAADHQLQMKRCTIVCSGGVCACQ
jgi:hypothetical protein